MSELEAVEEPEQESYQAEPWSDPITENTHTLVTCPCGCGHAFFQREDEHYIYYRGQTCHKLWRKKKDGIE